MSITAAVLAATVAVWVVAVIRDLTKDAEGRYALFSLLFAGATIGWLVHIWPK